MTALLDRLMAFLDDFTDAVITAAVDRITDAWPTPEDAL